MNNHTEKELEHGEHGQGYEPEKGHGGNNDHGNDMVTIYVNEVSYQIHRGHQTVMAIKGLAGVASTDVLYQMPDYIELDNGGSLVIHGDERFKSVAPSGSSS